MKVSVQKRVAMRKVVRPKWLRRSSRILFYTLLVAVGSAVLYWRYPNNVAHPNFYGEDGSVYLQNIINKGWLAALFAPFNGYFIFGLYGLCGFGWILNALFGSQGLLSLPTYFALAAIICMAATISLPWLLLKDFLGSKKMLLVVALGALLPLPLAPHIVIGTIGNQKWVFMYLAFVLTLYRLYSTKRLTLPRIIATDSLFVIAAYTNSTVYFLFPVLFLPYLRSIWQKKATLGYKSAIWLELRSKEVISLLILGLLLLPQVIYIGLHGIPKIAGYLDSPFQYARAIELLINRTYLFDFTHIVNGHLNDVLAITLFIILVGVGYICTRGKERVAFVLGLYSAGVASFLFAVNRPGVTDFFASYQSTGSGPDQFFYAQTLIMYIPLVLAVFAVARKLPRIWLRSTIPVVVCLLIAITGLLSNTFYGEKWRNASTFENDAGTFIDNSLAACHTKHSDRVKVTLYPYANGQFSLYAPRQQICGQQLKTYQSSVQDLGLKPNNNDFRIIDSNTTLHQTFKANEPKLDGIRIFLSNFGKSVREGTYLLVLYDRSCHTALRRQPIPSRLVDSSWYNVRFPAIYNSAGQIYCIQLQPPVGIYDPLALQLSKPGSYPHGLLTQNNRPLTNDIVFAPLYSQSR